LLVCRNDRGGGTQLEAAVERAAARAAVTLAGAQPAPPGRDFPRLRGFPEGDPFRALWLQRTG
jgi:23S rRNA G2069 N7-methylase RlmK/C1962 C5-methylase RlmI